ncbi:MAG: hypothetical protein WAT92_20405 [Saprospiraceae bacterium]|nr:hypothetical protein [Saprospiraceae bacterium]MBP7644466.1 hypothetical protein [Saprospiraceae bacterium]HMS67323.1 hypothetical protein [Saprospiraceae bacterium]
MRLITTVLLGFLCFIGTISAQEAGATFYTGLTFGSTKDIVINKPGQSQSGYLFGLDGRLNSGGLYFMLGGEYGKFDMMSQEKLNITSGSKFSFFKGRAGMGFKLFGTDKIYLSSKAQASFDIVLNSDDAIFETTSYQINDGFLGAATGLGLNIYALFIEFEYEHGILNMYYQKPETTINFYTIKAGVKF